MKISAAISMWMCVVFALGCFAFAFSGFMAVETLATEAERELFRGYAWFWMFLSVIATVFAVLSWMLMKGKLGDLE